MRHMTTGASLLLHRLVLEHERAHGVAVAVCTNGKLSSRRTQLAAHQRAMRIVTITALNQADIHAVPVGAGKLRSFPCVTSVTESWLGRCQQEAGLIRMMRRVTIDAAYTIGSVCGSIVVAVFQTALMTPEATLARLRSAQFRKANDLALVASTFHMR